MTVGVILSMEEELQSILEEFKCDIVENKNIKFYLFPYNHKNIILVLSGVGKVNAARSTQMLIDAYKPDLVINLGVGGATNKNLNLFDIVIADKLYQYDFDISIFDHKVGYVPLVGDNLIVSSNLIKEISSKLPNVKIGTIVTGDKFISNVDEKNTLAKKFNALICEMEGAAVGQVCFLNSTPYLVIRVVSDTLNGANYEYDKFLKKSCSILKSIFFKYL